MIDLLGELCAQWPGVSKAMVDREDASLLVVPVAAMDKLVSIVRSSLTPMVKKAFVKEALTQLDAEAGKLATKTPRYEHILSKKYHAQLAKTQLLGSPMRTKLKPMLDRVYAIAANVTQLIGAWTLGAADEYVELQSAETSLDVARNTMMVIAGVNVVESLHKHPQRKAMAAQVLSEGAEHLPVPLRLKLKDIVEKQS